MNRMSSHWSSDTYLGDVNVLHIEIIDGARRSSQCNKLEPVAGRHIVGPDVQIRDRIVI